ncbi:class I SAM-dependent methyltransferase [Myxococcota bacterium]|nr:class I SAM-dependent methyltransferase [Myxococcota bacterium]
MSSAPSKYEYVIRSLQNYHERPIEPKTRLLDFGSNHGDCVLGLRDDGYLNLHGYDISVAAIGRAKNRLDQQGIKEDIFFLEASELQDDFYEAAISTTVLEHVIDLEDVARILSEKLTAGGTFLAWYPPRFGLVEEHAFVPFAHWLPSGPLRVRYCDFFYRRSERAPMNGVECDRFLREECRYRSAHEVRKVFSKYFEEVRFVGLDMLAKRKGGEGSALSGVASRLTKLDPVLRSESLFADWVQARLLCRRPRRS